jgi:tetratricopeptide (TPR) repeat protein
LYLKGRHFWNHRPTGLDRAMDFFGRAIREDPKYALAYAGLADCYATQSAWESGALSPREGFPKARELATRAIELDETLAEAHSTLGYANLHFGWDWAAAERDFQRAIALNSGYAVAHHWYAHLLTAEARPEEALAAGRKALDLEPLDLITNVHMAWHQFYFGGVPEMEEAVRTLSELGPGAHWSEFWLGLLCERQQRWDDAAQALERAVVASQGSLVMRTAAARAAALAGRSAAARQELDSLQSLAGKQYVSSYELALIHVALGEQDEAFRLLDKAYEERSAWLAYFDVEPRLTALRGDERYARLLRQIGLPAGRK